MDIESKINTRKDAFAYFNSFANLIKEKQTGERSSLIEDFRNDPDYQAAKALIGQGRRIRHNSAFRIFPVISVGDDNTPDVLTKAVISRDRRGKGRGAYFKLPSTGDYVEVDLTPAEMEIADFSTRYVKRSDSITVDDRKIADRIKNLEQSLDGLIASSDQAVAKLREIQEQDEALDDPVYDVAGIVLKGGLFLYGAEVREKLASLVVKKSLNMHAAEKLKSTDVILNGCVFLRRDGISLLELMDVPGLIKKYDSAKIFNFMINNSFHTTDDEADFLAAVKEFPICRDYPNLTRENLDLAAYLLRNVSSLYPDLLESVIQLSNGDAREIAIRGKRLAESTAALREIFSQKIFSPEDKEFPLFREAVLQKLKKGGNDAIKILILADIASDVNRAGESYRNAQRLMQKDPEFYSVLAENLLVYNSLLPDEMKLASPDDVSLIFDPDSDAGVSSVSKVELNGLGRIIGAIFAKTAVNEIKIDPQLINWGKLVTPKNVYIEFESRPKKFCVFLGYESAQDESFEVDLIFDLYKNAYNWSFIEDPAELPALSSAFMGVVEQALNQILREVSKPKTEEAKPEVTKFAPSKSKVEKVRPERNLPSRKIAPRKILSPIEQALLEKMDDEETEVIRKIEIPENLGDICRRLSNFDQGIVAEGIEEFNQRGIGGFKMLKARGEEGESLYTLRINTRVPGGVRILLKERGSLNGIRNFEILDIDYRKDIYRKRGI